MPDPLADREIVIAVGGGIAAYKVAALTSRLVQRSAHVSVVMTKNAEEFIGSTTFSALTGRRVASHSFNPEQFPLGAHIELAERAELVVVAPATADVLAKAAMGIADDLLSTLLLCATCPILMAPAMNAAMWQKAAVQRNAAQLIDDGVELIQPTSGWLSCRTTGPGRMAEPETILTTIERVLDAS